MTTGRCLRRGTDQLRGGILLRIGRRARPGVCPEPQAQDEPGILEESRQDIATGSETLEGDDLLNRIDELVSRLRTTHPGVDRAELVNYLITACCPVVAQMDGLSEAETTARLDQFSERAFAAASR